MVYILVRTCPKARVKMPNPLELEIEVFVNLLTWVLGTEL